MVLFGYFHGLHTWQERKMEREREMDGRDWPSLNLGGIYEFQKGRSYSWVNLDYVYATWRVEKAHLDRFYGKSLVHFFCV